MRRNAIRVKAAAATVILVAAVFLATSCSSNPPSTSSSATARGPASSTSIESSTTSSGDAALGRSIYLSGADLSGRLIQRSGGAGMGMMGSGGCVTCHGSDGKGGNVRMMMARYDVPDIRWSALSQPMQMNGETEPAYDPNTFARAVREGIGSDGDELESIMPRWELTDPQVLGLIAYLMTL